MMKTKLRRTMAKMFKGGKYQDGQHQTEKENGKKKGVGKAKR